MQSTGGDNLDFVNLGNKWNANDGNALVHSGGQQLDDRRGDPPRTARNGMGIRMVPGLSDAVFSSNNCSAVHNHLVREARAAEAKSYKDVWKPNPCKRKSTE